MPNPDKTRGDSPIWHPYTQEALASEPVLIESGEGALLHARDGREFIDAISSWWVNLHGHAHPLIRRRIDEQLGKLEHVIFADFVHEPALELARRLLPLLPGGMSKVFFSDNGSTAVEVGLKMALQHFTNRGEERRKVIVFKDAYHGDTFGAMSLGERGAFTAPFASHLFPVEQLTPPLPGYEQSSLEELRKLLGEGGVAAFVFEPLIQCVAGMLIHSGEVLAEMIGLCRRYGVLTIADEVATGFGRTGRLFACDHLGKDAGPDILCLAKGLTGGFLPMGLTACTSSVYEPFHCSERSKTFFHGHSYCANPVGCAAALASLELLLAPSCTEAIATISEAQAVFAGALKGRASVQQPRSLGTIAALDLRTGEKTSYFHGLRDQARKFFLDRGVLLRPLGNVVYIMPPYVIRPEQLRRVHEVICEFLEVLESGRLWDRPGIPDMDGHPEGSSAPLVFAE
ncbi:MAG: adenosylmethionine--8-amino-7-oxononanoate transaminase [Planctomycetes bacterium]|nr:adenosylmethionine--8-amino-7-oxononanoate transaminase [Planctomycetota bacterium]